VRALAKALEKYGLQYSDVLMRRAQSLQQKMLDKAKRQENAALAYALRVSNVPHNAILLDDVCTTGATLEACAKILRENGTEVIGAVVVASD
jgi:predicted amidophosphoribosyltransferase